MLLPYRGYHNLQKKIAQTSSVKLASFKKQNTKSAPASFLENYSQTLTVVFFDALHMLAMFGQKSIKKLP